MSDFWGTIGTGAPVPWPDPRFNSTPSLHPWLDGNLRKTERTMPTTCQQCIQRLKAAESAGKRVVEVYEVGNVAKNQMGHAMYFAPDGRTALCAAKTRTPA